MGRNKHVKKKWHTQQNKSNRNLCGCYLCVGTDYIEWLRLKYFVKLKHSKQDITDF
jgi:hypothetical protein